MADEKLTCTKTILVSDGRDAQGRPLSFHKKCGAPAAEYEIGGLLTKAKAVLCIRHKELADRETFTSDRGFPLGKVAEKAKKDGYKQERLPGTGVS